MAESNVNVTEGSGKKLHTNSRTIGANTVEDEYVLMGESFLAHYVNTSGAVSIATANDHVIAMNAGASLNLYVRRILVYQNALATTAAIARFQLRRVTTLGTGGVATTTSALDSTDSAAGFSCLTINTVKGTEGAIVGERTAQVIQTVGTGGAGFNPLLLDFDFDRLHGKSLRIPAGTANGFVLKIITATAAATVFVETHVTEANF